MNEKVTKKKVRNKMENLLEGLNDKQLEGVTYTERTMFNYSRCWKRKDESYNT